MSLVVSIFNKLDSEVSSMIQDMEVLSFRHEEYCSPYVNPYRDADSTEIFEEYLNRFDKQIKSLELVISYIDDSRIEINYNILLMMCKKWVRYKKQCEVLRDDEDTKCHTIYGDILNHYKEIKKMIENK